MRKVIPFMEFIRAVSFIFHINIIKTEVFCKVFKDNQIFIDVVDSNKLSPRRKYIAIKYHHFQIFVQKKIIWIRYVDTIEQTAEIFTNPFNKALFVYLQRNLSVW